MKAFDYIEIRVPAKSQYVSVIRLTISGLAMRVGFTYDEIEDLKIATSEAVTNVVHHAYKANEDGEVEEVKSKIGPYHEDENVALLREGGLGIFLMETLMDEVKLTNEGGVTVFMTKYVSREQVKGNVERITT